MQQPPGYGQRPLVRMLLMGCAGVFVLLIAAGGVAAWFALHAMHAALTRSERAVSVARSAITPAERAESDARAGEARGRGDASPDPAREAAAGIAMLKSFVSGGKSHVEAVPRAALEAVLPASVDALIRKNAESSKTSISGISGTSASAKYGGPGVPTIEIEVTDAANMSGLTTFMNLAMSAVTKDDTQGYERTVDLGDIKVHEQWVNEGKRATLLGLAGDRFVISVESDGLGMASTEQAFRGVDVAKLASLAAVDGRTPHS